MPVPFRGFKHQLWEGGLRVPTFVYGAGVPSGQIRTEITAQIDCERAVSIWELVHID